MRGCNEKITVLNRKHIFQLFKGTDKKKLKETRLAVGFVREKRELSLRFFFGFLSGQVNVTAIDALFVPEVRFANVSFSFDWN